MTLDEDPCSRRAVRGVPDDELVYACRFAREYGTNNRDQVCIAGTLNWYILLYTPYTSRTDVFFSNNM